MMDSKYISIAQHFGGNKDFQSWVRRQRRFILQSERTSKSDKSLVFDALLMALRFVSLQCTWWSSLSGWSSVTLKSQPTGFITTLITAAPARSASNLTNQGKELCEAFHELRLKQTRGRPTAHPTASHDFFLSPCYKVQCYTLTGGCLTISTMFYYLARTWLLWCLSSSLLSNNGTRT